MQTEDLIYMFYQNPGPVDAQNISNDIYSCTLTKKLCMFKPFNSLKELIKGQIICQLANVTINDKFKLSE